MALLQAASTAFPLDAVAPPSGWPLAVCWAVPVRVKLYTSFLALRRLPPCACARFLPVLRRWLSRAFGVLLWRAWQPHALLPFWPRFSPALAPGSYRIPVDRSGRHAATSIVETKLSLSWRCIYCMSTNLAPCGHKPSKVGCVLVCASMPQPKNLLRLYGCCIHSRFSCLHMSCKYDKRCIADLRSVLGNFLCLSMRCMPCIAMAGPLPHDVWHTPCKYVLHPFASIALLCMLQPASVLCIHCTAFLPGILHVTLSNLWLPRAIAAAAVLVPT